MRPVMTNLGVMTTIGPRQEISSPANGTLSTSCPGVADVDVTLEIWPHVIHAWPMWNAS
jgi:hypothetical protein